MVTAKGTAQPIGGGAQIFPGGLSPPRPPRGYGPAPMSGGGGYRVQVRGNFHILTSKNKQKTEGGGVKPPKPTPWIRHWGEHKIKHILDPAVLIEMKIKVGGGRPI